MAIGFEKLIDELPKAELHLHIEGSLEPERMFALAQRNQMTLRFKTVDEVKEAYQFENLQAFLDIYYEGAQVLLKKQDFYDLTWDYLVKINAENVQHVEIFFDPQTHTDRNVSFSTVILGIHEALVAGETKFGISFRLIMCFLRHLSEEAAFKTLEQSLPYLSLISAVGLDSSEIGHPAKRFAGVFAKARELGLFAVAHAGEEAPPESIWQALDILQVRRIDHGVRCLEDVKLVERLKSDQTPLTVCPLSNVKLRVFERLQDHNLKKLLEAGLCVMINSDDPAYFGGYLKQNYVSTQKALGLSVEQVGQLVKNSFIASFLPAHRKQEYISNIDDVIQRYA